MTNYSNERAFDSGLSHTGLTPSQRLAAIEHSRALNRQRRQATAKVCGLAVLVLVTAVLTEMRLTEFVMGGAIFGAVIAAAAIWSPFGNHPRSLELSSKADVDPRLLKDLDQRLANLETIVGFEEKVAARNRHLEND